MGVIELPSAFGHTIFCDDVRAEAGGKISYMGVYSGVLYAHQAFPTSIAKLCISINLYQSEETFDPNLKIKIFLPEIEGDRYSPETVPSMEASFTEKETGAAKVAAAAASPAAVLAGPERQIRMNLNLVAAPLILLKPGIISVRAFRKSDVVRLGQIMVLQAPTVESPKPS